VSGRLFLVRHGEAAAAWGDDPDPGLSAAGVAQAEAVAVRLAALGIAGAATSPLRRCIETAAPFARLASVEPRIEPCVAEIPTPADVIDRKSWLRGLMDGGWADIAPAHARLLRDWRMRLIWTLTASPQDQIVFTHFVAINVALGFALGSDAFVVDQPANCAVVAFERAQGGLRVTAHGAAGASIVL